MEFYSSSLCREFSEGSLIQATEKQEGKQVLSDLGL